MSTNDFFGFISNLYDTEGAVGYLIENILKFAEISGFSKDELHRYLRYMLEGAIDLTDEEIALASF